VTYRQGHTQLKHVNALVASPAHVKGQDGGSCDTLLRSHPQSGGSVMTGHRPRRTSDVIEAPLVGTCRTAVRVNRDEPRDAARQNGPGTQRRRLAANASESLGMT
jgi:hypothetical protein